ncbi:MAG: M23 family metallopeptidase [Deltaproteobacteria bacterium]|nr:M23 family metallopeptidase [Deltaproteobacteria bacterium]
MSVVDGGLGLRRARPLALSLALVSACVTQTATTTWEDDAEEGISTNHRRFGAPAQVSDRSRSSSSSSSSSSPNAPARWTRASGGVAGNPPPSAPSPAELMEVIASLRARRVSLTDASSAPPTSSAPPKAQASSWPSAITKLWAETLHALARGLAAESVPLPVLLQTRVTIEVELEDTEACFGAAPPEIKHRIGLVYVLVAQHMRAGAFLAHGRRRPSQRGLGRGQVALEWPVTPVIVTSPFGRRRDPIAKENRLGFHAGVDLGGQRGTLVAAAAPGRVVHAGWRGGHGRSVTIRHTRDLVTVYSHLGTIFVHEGDDLDLGSPVGLMGSSGRTTGPHLHFEVRREGKALNPMDFVERLLLSYVGRNGHTDGI